MQAVLFLRTFRRNARLVFELLFSFFNKWWLRVFYCFKSLFSGEEEIVANRSLVVGVAVAVVVG